MSKTRERNDANPGYVTKKQLESVAQQMNQAVNDLWDNEQLLANNLSSLSVAIHAIQIVLDTIAIDLHLLKTKGPTESVLRSVMSQVGEDAYVPLIDWSYYEKMAEEDLKRSEEALKTEKPAEDSQKSEVEGDSTKKDSEPEFPEGSTIFGD